MIHQLKNALLSVSSVIFLNSSCLGYVPELETCTIYCEAQDYKENEILVVTKYTYFNTLDSASDEW